MNTWALPFDHWLGRLQWGIKMSLRRIWLAAVGPILNRIPTPCAVCKHRVPGEFVCNLRHANSSFLWPEAVRLGRWICFECADHRICYPFLELAIQGSLASDGKPIISSPAQIAEWQADATIERHQCCIANDLERLRAWRAKRDSEPLCR